MPKRIVLAWPRGYCAGVERAIDTVERALRIHGPPVYVRKQIVHNIHVVRDPDPANVSYLSQTKLPVDETNGVIDVLRERFPAVQAPPRDDICYATQNRQEAVKGIAAEADVILVIGSDNSSNSKRLVEVA